MAVQQILFAFDCGATNWRIYRCIYHYENGKAVLSGEPQISPLTSFSERSLPAVILLDQDNKALESFGENAKAQIQDENKRGKIHSWFKPAIGAHLSPNPQAHQTRCGHSDALDYTRLLLQSLLEQIKIEKLRGEGFNHNHIFSFAYPVHWRSEHEGNVFKDFRRTILSCFPLPLHEQVRFVAEPEGAILALLRQGILAEKDNSANVLIIDVGGSTSDIVAGRINPGSGRLEYLGRCGLALGGLSYDTHLAEHIAKDIELPADMLAEHPWMNDLLQDFARRLKESLSRQQLQPGRAGQPPQRMISLVNQNNEVYRKLIKLDAALFNTLCAELDQRFRGLVNKALRESRLAVDEIDQVILAGGGSQLFSLVNLLREQFGEDKVILADNPAEIVVQGIGLEYGKSFENYQPTIVFTPAPISKPEKPKERKEIKFTLQGNHKTFELQSGTRCGVGREKINQIKLESAKISRFHAVFTINREHAFLEDLGSTNGTFLNSKKLNKGDSQILTDGDQIRFGDNLFTFHQKE